MILLRHDLFPERHPLDAGDVSDLQREGAADPDLLIGRDDGLKMLGIEREQRQHVLDRGHPGPQALGGAEQRPRAHLGGRTLGVCGRESVEQPHLQRQGLEAAFEKHVVRVVMRVDEARHDQLAGRVDRPLRRAEPGADSRDPVAFDQDVRARRPVGIARVIVDPAAPDQDAGRSVRHLLPPSPDPL